MKRAKESATLDNVPHGVLYIWAMGNIGQPIDTDTYNRAIANHPEYFPDEIEFRRRFDAIPEDIKKEHSKLFDTLIGSNIYTMYESKIGKLPHSELCGKGIIYRVTHPELKDKYEAYDEWMRKMFELHEKDREDGYNRLFNPYGLKSVNGEKQLIK